MVTRAERWLNEKIAQPRYWTIAGAMDFLIAGRAHDWQTRAVCIASGLYILLGNGRKAKVSS